MSYQSLLTLCHLNQFVDDDDDDSQVRLVYVEGTYSLVSRATLMADTEHSSITEQQVLVKSIKGMCRS